MIEKIRKYDNKVELKVIFPKNKWIGLQGWWVLTKFNFKKMAEYSRFIIAKDALTKSLPNTISSWFSQKTNDSHY